MIDIIIIIIIINNINLKKVICRIGIEVMKLI